MKKINLILCFIACSFLLIGCKKTESKINVTKNVTPKPITVKESHKNLTLNLGELKNINNKDSLDSIQSSNKKVATVSNNGTIHAIKNGETTITMKTKTTKQIFHIKVKKFGFVFPTFSMMKTEQLQLLFNHGEKGTSWKSSNPSVATVTKKGKVAAKKKGTATIVCQAGNHTYACQLKVTKHLKNVIYLTFDDGPNSYTTPKILNILKKNNVKATFFELRPASYDFVLTKRLLDEGHTLALHGFQHKYNIVYRSEKVYKKNLDKLRQMFFKKFGVWCVWSRFPGGSSNTCSSYNPGIMTRITKKIDGWGYRYMDWNVTSGDAERGTTAQMEFNYFKNGLVKGRPNVVLMHDFYKNYPTLKSLDKIIKYGKKQGFTFLPLTASSPEVHHRIAN